MNIEYFKWLTYFQIIRIYFQINYIAARYHQIKLLKDIPKWNADISK